MAVFARLSRKSRGPCFLCTGRAHTCYSNSSHIRHGCSPNTIVRRNSPHAAADIRLRRACHSCRWRQTVQHVRAHLRVQLALLLEMKFSCYYRPLLVDPPSAYYITPISLQHLRPQVKIKYIPTGYLAILPGWVLVECSNLVLSPILI